jgi:hypothetical protein
MDPKCSTYLPMKKYKRVKHGKVLKIHDVPLDLPCIMHIKPNK